jgi:hypothetical protein
MLTKIPEFMKNCPPIPIDEFAEAVKDGCFIDYDGEGCLGTETHEDCDFVVKPSTFKREEAPAWATHVVWYNR